jgi:hypothetical protein
MEEIKSTKERKLYPKKLMPPPNILKAITEKERDRLPTNPIIRFFKIFFGEGF